MLLPTGPGCASSTIQVPGQLLSWHSLVSCHELPKASQQGWLGVQRSRRLRAVDITVTCSRHECGGICSFVLVELLSAHLRSAATSPPTTSSSFRLSTITRRSWLVNWPCSRILRDSSLIRPSIYIQPSSPSLSFSNPASSSLSPSMSPPDVAVFPSCLVPDAFPRLSLVASKPPEVTYKNVDSG